MNIYKISKGQIITVWIFGLLIAFVLFLAGAGSYEPSLSLLIFSIFILGALIFYTLGWRKVNKFSVRNSGKSGTVNTGFFRLIWKWFLGVLLKIKLAFQSLRKTIVRDREITKMRKDEDRNKIQSRGGIIYLLLAFTALFSFSEEIFSGEISKVALLNLQTSIGLALIVSMVIYIFLVKKFLIKTKVLKVAILLPLTIFMAVAPFYYIKYTNNAGINSELENDINKVMQEVKTAKDIYEIDQISDPESKFGIILNDFVKSANKIDGEYQNNVDILNNSPESNLGSIDDVSGLLKYKNYLIKVEKVDIKHSEEYIELNKRYENHIEDLADSFGSLKEQFLEKFNKSKTLQENISLHEERIRLVQESYAADYVWLDFLIDNQENFYLENNVPHFTEDWQVDKYNALLDATDIANAKLDEWMKKAESLEKIRMDKFKDYADSLD